MIKIFSGYEDSGVLAAQITAWEMTRQQVRPSTNELAARDEHGLTHIGRNVIIDAIEYAVSPGYMADYGGGTLMERQPQHHALVRFHLGQDARCTAEGVSVQEAARAAAQAAESGEAAL